MAWKPDYERETTVTGEKPGKAEKASVEKVWKADYEREARAVQTLTAPSTTEAPFKPEPTREAPAVPSFLSKPKPALTSEETKKKAADDWAAFLKTPSILMQTYLDEANHGVPGAAERYAAALSKYGHELASKLHPELMALADRLNSGQPFTAQDLAVAAWYLGEHEIGYWAEGGQIKATYGAAKEGYVIIEKAARKLEGLSKTDLAKAYLAAQKYQTLSALAAAYSWDWAFGSPQLDSANRGYANAAAALIVTKFATGLKPGDSGYMNRDPIDSLWQAASTRHKIPEAAGGLSEKERFDLSNLPLTDPSLLKIASTSHPEGIQGSLSVAYGEEFWFIGEGSGRWDLWVLSKRAGPYGTEYVLTQNLGVLSQTKYHIDQVKRWFSWNKGLIEGPCDALRSSSDSIFTSVAPPGTPFLIQARASNLVPEGTSNRILVSSPGGSPPDGNGDGNGNGDGDGGDGTQTTLLIAAAIIIVIIIATGAST